MGLKRTSLKPGDKPLRRKSWLKPKSWFRAKSKPRKAPVHEAPIPKLRWRGMTQSERTWRRNWHSPAYVGWIVSQPCEVTGTPANVAKPDPAHSVPRDLGGTWRNLVPLRRDVHTDYDDTGLSDRAFEILWGRTRESIREAAPSYHARYTALFPDMED